MSRNAIETIMGAVVLAIAGGFLAFAYETSDIRGGRSGGYRVHADFTNIGGVGKGSDVRIGGVKVGTIEDVALQPESYEARVTLAIDSGIEVPSDSSASIASDGLLGSKYIALQPGADQAMLKEGGAIEYTQASVSLEELIGKFVFSGGGVDKGGQPGDGKPENPAGDGAPAPAAGKAPAGEPELSLP